MEDALRTRSAARGWLRRMAKQCEKVTAALPDVEEEVYEAAVTNFNTRLTAWDTAQSRVESLAAEE